MERQVANLKNKRDNLQERVGTLKQENQDYYYSKSSLSYSLNRLQTKHIELEEKFEQSQAELQALREKNHYLEKENQLQSRKLAVTKEKLSEYLMQIGYSEENQGIMNFDRNAEKNSESKDHRDPAPSKCLCLVEVDLKSFELKKLEKLSLE